jgi:hypothetical protein
MYFMISLSGLKFSYMVWHVLGKENKKGYFKNLESKVFFTLCDLRIKLCVCISFPAQVEFAFSLKFHLDRYRFVIL